MMPNQAVFQPSASPGFWPAARWAGNMLFSGPIDGGQTEGQGPGDPLIEVERAFRNLQVLISDCGCTPADLAQCFIWLGDSALREAVRKQWRAIFPDPANSPARHIIGADFPDGRVIALDFIAIKGARRRALCDVPGVTLALDDSDAPIAVEMGGLLFASNITGLTADGSLPDDPGAQADACFDNLSRIFEHCGFERDEAAHMFVWQRDHSLRQRVNDPWAATFPNKFLRPARHALKVDSGRFAIQLSVIAACGGERTTLTALGGLSHTGQREPGFLPMSSARGNMLFTGATFGASKETGAFIAELEDQVGAAFKHTMEILAAHQFRPQDVVHAYIWHRGEDYRPIFDPLWEAAFPDAATRPVRHDIESPLPDPLRMQIELIAVRQ
jgi:2-iminobutanoate/2-iminopropanoate deaminase